MVYFTTQAEAEQQGFIFEHRAAENRFVVANEDGVIGYARYSKQPDGSINFNSTMVDPNYRGSGLAHLLVKLALGDDLVKNAKVLASCWYVDELLAKHPEYLAEGASFIG